MSNNSQNVYKRYTGSHHNYWRVYVFMTLNISYSFFYYCTSKVISFFFKQKLLQTEVS